MKDIKLNMPDSHDTVHIGEKIHPFIMDAYLPDGTFGQVSIKKNMDEKKWTILYFYPADFTFVCPTEIKAFDAMTKEFNAEGAELIGISTDKVHSHKAWVERDFGGSINHALAEDPTGDISKYFRVYDEVKGLAWRGLFIISPDGTLWTQYVNFGEAGRSADEALRLLTAVKEAAAGEMVPCGWQKGDKTL